MCVWGWGVGGGGVSIMVSKKKNHFVSHSDHRCTIQKICLDMKNGYEII